MSPRVRCQHYPYLDKGRELDIVLLSQYLSRGQQYSLMTC